MAAAFLLASAGTAFAQQAPQPTPPQPDTTTVTEPLPKPGSPESEQPKEQTKEQGPAHVPPDASGIDLTTLETKDVDLLYFDPVQTYVTPYIARAFENAINFHKKMFVWQPWDRTTMLLKDFSDYGNAGARASPNNAVLLDIAPLSVAWAHLPRKLDPGGGPARIRHAGVFGEAPDGGAAIRGQDRPGFDRAGLCRSTRVWAICR